MELMYGTMYVHLHVFLPKRANTMKKQLGMPLAIFLVSISYNGAKLCA